MKIEVFSDDDAIVRGHSHPAAPRIYLLIATCSLATHKVESLGTSDVLAARAASALNGKVTANEGVPPYGS